MATRVMQPERRRAPRATARVSVAITDSGTELQAQTLNLSAIGAYCTLDRFIAPMTKLQLRLTLPNGSRPPTAIRGAGVVVRVEPVVTSIDRACYHTAIYFTGLSERDRSAISRFVRQRLSTRTSTR